MGDKPGTAAGRIALDVAIARAGLAAARLARLVEDRDRLGLGTAHTRPALARAEARLAALLEERRGLPDRPAEG